MAEPITRDQPLRGSLIRRHFDADGGSDIPPPRRRRGRQYLNAPPAPSPAQSAAPTPTHTSTPAAGGVILTLGALIETAFGFVDAGTPLDATILALAVDGTPVPLVALAIAEEG